MLSIHLKLMFLSLATTFGVLALLVASQSIAEDTPDKPQVVKPITTIELGECLVSFGTTPKQLKIKERPTIILEFCNPTDQPVELNPQIKLMSQPWQPPLARMMMMPTPQWTDILAVKLNPNETRKVTVTAEFDSPAGSTLHFVLTHDTRSLQSQRFRVELTDQQKKNNPLRNIKPVNIPGPAPVQTQAATKA